MKKIFITFALSLIVGCGGSSPEGSEAQKSNDPVNVQKIAKKDGTFDERPNDLHELCKDFVYYKAKSYKYGREGNQKRAQEARIGLEKTNIWLSQYHESDVAEICSLYDTKENLSKYMR